MCLLLSDESDVKLDPQTTNTKLEVGVDSLFLDMRTESILTVISTAENLYFKLVFGLSDTFHY